MANICCDDVIFYTEGNPEGLYDLWEDLETYIILNQNPDLCWIGNLFSHKKIDSTGISLRGNVSYMEWNDTYILLSLETAWTPLYEAYQAIAAAYHVPFVPLVAVILIERFIFTSPPPPVFHVECRGRDLLLCQIYGDLVSVFPVQKQTENKAYNLGGFLVDYPKVLVVRVFDIAVRGFGGNRLSAHAFGLNARFHFFADRNHPDGCTCEAAVECRNSAQ